MRGCAAGDNGNEAQANDQMPATEHGLRTQRDLEAAYHNTQSVNWMGILRNVGENYNGGILLNDLIERKLIIFGICQVERGLRTGMVHLQIFIQLPMKQRKGYLTRNIHGTINWISPKNTPAECIEYCSKKETRVAGPWRVGTAKAQGKPQTLEAACEMVRTCEHLTEIAEQYPVVWVLHSHGLTNLRKDLNLDRDQRRFGRHGPEVWVFWGETGTGKSLMASLLWPDAFWKMTSERWWDGYRGQETIIIDDFKETLVSFADMQRLLGRDPLWLDVKFGSVPCVAKRYVFTSNYHPYTWYREGGFLNKEIDFNGTMRRRIYEFAEKFGRMICTDGEEWLDDIPRLVDEANRLAQEPPEERPATATQSRDFVRGARRRRNIEPEREPELRRRPVIGPVILQRRAEEPSRVEETQRQTQEDPRSESPSVQELSDEPNILVDTPPRTQVMEGFAPLREREEDARARVKNEGANINNFFRTRPREGEGQRLTDQDVLSFSTLGHSGFRAS